MRRTKMNDQNPFADDLCHAESTDTEAIEVELMASLATAEGQNGEKAENVFYQMVATGPPVLATEIDTDQPNLEVVIIWGKLSVLHVAHLSPTDSFSIGDATDDKGRLLTDFLIDSSTLGSELIPLVVPSSDGTWITVPKGAECEVTLDDQSLMLGELQDKVKIKPCDQLSEARQFILPDQGLARVFFNGFIFSIRNGRSVKNVGKPQGIGLDWHSNKWTLFSALITSILLLMFYLLPPSTPSLSLELLNQDHRLIRFLIEPNERYDLQLDDWIGPKGGEKQGKAHKGEMGKMGKKTSKKTTNRSGIKGPKSNSDPHMANKPDHDDARNSLIVGILNRSAAWNSPTSPFGRKTALGNDPMSSVGAIMGDLIGDNFGYGGLGSRGTGRGGGGTGEGTIGVGPYGTIGRGLGNGTGDGYGRLTGLRSKARRSDVPRIRHAKADVQGSLSKEVIRRYISRHINEVRFCYEQALNSRPDLQGRVAVKFIISPTGLVKHALISSSSLNSTRVETCIQKAFLRFDFPPPDNGGMVVVTYPFVFQPASG